MKLGISRDAPQTDAQSFKRIEDDNSLTEVIVERGFFGRIPATLSIGVITFGVLLFARDLGVSELNSYIIAFIAFSLLIVVEAVRTKYFAEVLSYFLERRVVKNTSYPWFGSAFFGLVTSMFIALDVWSGVQGGTSLYNRYINSGVENSLEYKAAKAQAQSGAKNTQLYLSLLEQYRTDQEQANAQCDATWKMPTYRTRNANCKKDWVENNPKPKLESIKTSTEVSVQEISKIQTAVQDGATFLMNYLHYIIMGLSLLLTLFALIGPINSFRQKKKRLTNEVIEKLRQRHEDAQKLKLERVDKSNELQKQAHQKRNEIDQEIEEIVYATTHKQYENTRTIAQNALNRMSTIKEDEPIDVEPINNPKMIPQAKAGFIGEKYKGVRWNTKPPVAEDECTEDTEQFDFDLGVYNGNSSRKD